MTPKVSIITPTYNRAGLLPQAVRSVLAQQLDDFELVVVDDGSDDGTGEVVREFRDPRIVHVGREHSGNLSVLRNVGFDRARGELIAFLDSDDVWHEDKLRAQVEALDRHPDAGFSFTGLELFNSEGPLGESLYRGLPGASDGLSVLDIFRPLITAEIVIYTSTVIVRRDAAHAVGLLNPGLRTGDYEFFTRLASRYRCAVLHSPMVRIRKHGGNTSLRLDAEGLEEAIFSVERFGASGEIPRRVYREMAHLFRSKLGEVFEKRGELSAARREYLACARLRPLSPRTWARYLSACRRS
jgi:glycosyltransferase involved in cell wall biosynthesis